MANGEGIFKSDTVFYQGSWKDDQYHGSGELRVNDWVYKGDFACGKREGYGRQSFGNSNNYYEGQFFNDYMNGKGEMQVKSNFI